MFTCVCNALSVSLRVFFLADAENRLFCPGPVQARFFITLTERSDAMKDRNRVREVIEADSPYARGTDEYYMDRAIRLARLGAGHVNPNPLVGAVIVKSGRIIGAGYHEEIGGLHAERNALAACTEDPAGSDIYVTLEPCCHYGKQPPCTDALLAAGVRRVIIGSRDPNPLVSGKGVRILREQGVEVVTDFLRAECDRLNPVFFHYITRKQPYVTLKYAMTLDGKIASAAGESRWISSEASREKARRDRGLSMGILVGVGTVLADDPALTCRTPGAIDPVRVILDTRLRTPLTAQVMKTAAVLPAQGGLPEVSTRDGMRYPRTVIATCEKDKNKLEPYQKAGALVLSLPPDEDGRVSVPVLLKKLGAMKMDSLYVEGGGNVHWSFLRERAADKVQIYIGPLLLGGADARSPVEGAGFPSPPEALRLTGIRTERIGDDLFLEGYPRTGGSSCLQE